MGEKWVGRLQALGIPFCIRFPKSLKLKTSKGSTPTADRPQGKRVFETFGRRPVFTFNG
jgi:hypothetical protein